jgi:hypothetical protein
VRLGALVFTVRAMHVRSFEIHEVADTDLRRLHDYLLEVGGFEFRAGGSGFFVLVGERFVASAGATNAQVIMASREADTINVDVVALFHDGRLLPNTEVGHIEIDGVHAEELTVNRVRNDKVLSLEEWATRLDA